MKRTKYKLDINKSIALGDARRVRKGLEPIKTRRSLAKYLSTNTLTIGTLNAIYSRLYRYEYDGFYTKNEQLINRVMSILKVSEKELITKF